MQREILEVFELRSEHEQAKFRNLARTLNTTHPFSRLEFLKNTNSPRELLRYFAFFIDDTPKILMLFYLRPISILGRPTGHYDTISPYSYSGPLFDPEVTETEIQNFWKSVDTWYSRNHVISEFVRFSLNNNHIHYSGVTVPTLRNIVGTIIDPENQWTNFKKKVRNNIRKAIKNELECVVYHNNIEATNILEFYNIYTSTLDRKDAEKRYYYSLPFFKELISKNPGICALALVRKGETAISAELLILSRDSIYSFLGGTYSNYFEYRPNDLLKYGVINWGRECEFKYYILGGGQVDGDSLYRYKKAFFPKDEEVTFYTGRKIINETIYNILVNEFESVGKPVSPVSHPIDQGFFPRYRSDNFLIS